MQAILISGYEEKRKEYIKSFIDTHKLPAYSIHSFEESIKISDVRSCIKLFAQRLGVGEKRLIIFSGTLTVDAQNALLKSLEELNTGTYIIFSVAQKEELLPTILSRCNSISFISTQDKKNNDLYSRLLQDFFKKMGIQSVFKLSDELNITTNSQYEELIFSTRNLLLESVDYHASQSLLYFLEKLQEYYPLIIHNNVNKKYVIETLLLTI